MSRWFVTFGVQYPWGRRYYEIEADTKADARARAVDLFADRWAFIYDEAGFAGQPEQYGLSPLLQHEADQIGRIVEAFTTP